MLFRFDIEERKCSSKSITRQIWYWFHNDVIWFCHQNVIFFDICLFQPLHECPRSVQNYIALVRTRREWLSNKGRNLIHEVIGFTRMQNPGEPTHVRIRHSSKLLEPIVHYPALPSIVDAFRSGHSSVEEPPLG
uniref:Uncharacterized protein n=1 Tax=Opuntia streptacantha TaxID=393608 RepID=A0A7C9CWD7_OPUST